MKRLLGVTIAILIALMVTGTVSANETETEAYIFNHEELFSQFENYKYDRFDKKWKCFGAVLKAYSDANVVFGIEVNGDDDHISIAPGLYAFIEDTQSSKIETNGNRIFLHNINKIQFLIGDVVYTFDPVYCFESEGYVYLYEEYKEIIDALADTDSVVMKLSWDDGNVETEFTPEEYAGFKEFVAYLKHIDVWKYCKEETEGFKDQYLAYYKMTVTK